MRRFGCPTAKRYLKSAPAIVKMGKYRRGHGQRHQLPALKVRHISRQHVNADWHHARNQVGRHGRAAPVGDVREEREVLGWVVAKIVTQ